MDRILQWAFTWFFLLVLGQMAFSDDAKAADIDHRSNRLAIESEGEHGLDDQNSASRTYLFQNLTMSLYLSGGVRFDELQWSIAGSDAGTDPNVLSELEWSQVLSHQISLGGIIQLRHFYGRAQADYAWIQSGSVRDSDYNGDNRTLEYSRSVSETNGDQLWDVTAGIGYPFGFRGNRFWLAPMLGLSYHRQNFRITNGQQIISENSAPPVGPLDSRLNSMYSAEWLGFWTGCDLRYQMASPPKVPPPMTWGLSLVYHFRAYYYAEADWNLRGDLQHPVSFEHDAYGQGISVMAEWVVRLTRHLAMRLNVNYSRWWTDHGSDIVYTASGTSLSTRLNEVIWQSHSTMIGIAYRF